MVVKELFKVKVKCLTWVCTIYYTYGKNATNTIEHADFFVQVFELFFFHLNPLTSVATLESVCSYIHLYIAV